MPTSTWTGIGSPAVSEPRPTGKTFTIDVPVVGQYKQDIVQTPDGLRWVHGKGSQDILAIYHEMEPPGHSIHDYICGHFRPGLVFLDIGAHVGHYAIRAAMAGCTVYAVEANPESAAQLRMNMRVNGITNLTLWSIAAWDRHTVISFVTDPAYPDFRNGGNSLMPKEGHEKIGITVAGVPLNLLLSELDQLDLIKMDVEGADLRVLKGMRQSLLRLRPKLIIEDHSLYGYFTAAELEASRTGLRGYTWEHARDLGIEGLNNYWIGTP
jgi:FkbM family methyltransferase